MASACGDKGEFEPISEKESHSGAHAEEKSRVPSSESRRVLLLYAAGYNNLSSYIRANIESLVTGYLPSDGRRENVLLVFSKLRAPGGGSSTPVRPSLVRLYRDAGGTPVADTLLTWPEETLAASPKTVNEVLAYVRDTFPAAGYGMIFSSHATGWLPAGYFENPGRYDDDDTDFDMFEARSGRKELPASPFRDPVPVPYVEPEADPSLPAVKSIGQEVVTTGHSTSSYEMEIEEFAAAIPMHLDYLLFDACLMGCIEVAYALRDACGQVGFSPTEVLAEGFDYTTLASRLLEGAQADPLAVCRDYFNRYDQETGAMRSATITLVDCSRLEELAGVCADLFDRYRDGLAAVNPSAVQRYFREDKHWFYDLEDILDKAGASPADLSRLQDAVAASIRYKAATEQFMSASFKIKVYSGYGMYLPANGSAYLDAYYRNLSWNRATGLVR